MVRASNGGRTSGASGDSNGVPGLCESVHQPPLPDRWRRSASPAARVDHHEMRTDRMLFGPLRREQAHCNDASQFAAGWSLRACLRVSFALEER